MNAVLQRYVAHKADRKPRRYSVIEVPVRRSRKSLIESAYRVENPPRYHNSTSTTEDHATSKFKQLSSYHPFKTILAMSNFLALFVDLSREPQPRQAQDVGLHVLVPAFMISELRRAFEIGFLLFVPFLIIDLVVASILMSVGMMMLPPVTVALPFKLIFFVLVDGWGLVAGSLVKSYGG